MPRRQTGALPHGALRWAAELQAGRARDVFAAVRATPGASLSEVARQLGMNLATTHRTVERLVQVGLIEKGVAGREVRLRARPGIGLDLGSPAVPRAT